MNLDTITEEWKKDSVIDQIMLDQATLRIPQLHQKYLSWRNEFSLLQKRKRQELKKLQHYKTLYYGGRLSAEEYKEPLNHKILKGEIPTWVEVDDEVNKIESQLDYYQEIVFTLDDILKQIHQLSYNIKNIIQWRTFVGGTGGI